MEEYEANTNIRSKSDEAYQIEFERKRSYLPKLQEMQAPNWNDLIKEFKSSPSFDQKDLFSPGTYASSEEINIFPAVEVIFDECDDDLNSSMFDSPVKGFQT